jgi:hypothetical protein
MTDSAITTEHVNFIADWNTEYGCTVKTRWFDTKRMADAQAEAYRNAGADNTSVSAIRTCLGRYKTVGYFMERR